jgi:hypothetical protein
MWMRDLADDLSAASRELHSGAGRGVVGSESRRWFSVRGCWVDGHGAGALR